MAPKGPQLEEIVRTRVRELRAERGLTQEQLCERAGVSIDAVSRIEGGSRVPTLDTMERLARALAVSPVALLESNDAAAIAAPKVATPVRRIVAVLEDQPDDVQKLAEQAVASVVRAFAAGKRTRNRRGA